jgi:hypothetical protein
MLEADPDFAMGNIFTMGMDAFGEYPSCSTLLSVGRS